MPDLYALLLHRLADFRPAYIGEFACEDALPRRRRYPPLYAWIDGAGDLHLYTDRAALVRLCVIESIRTGRPARPGDDVVQQAVDRFTELSSRAAAETLRAAAGLDNLKSARQRAAARWGAKA